MALERTARYLGLAKKNVVSFACLFGKLADAWRQDKITAFVTKLLASKPIIGPSPTKASRTQGNREDRWISRLVSGDLIRRHDRSQTVNRHERGSGPCGLQLNMPAGRAE